MIESRGNIVNVASALALIAKTDEAAYHASKAGVVHLSKSMALDYATQIRVNCVCPGAVRTAMIESVLPPGAERAAALAEYGLIHPLHRRLAEPEEIADAVLFPRFGRRLPHHRSRDARRRRLVHGLAARTMSEGRVKCATADIGRGVQLYYEECGSGTGYPVRTRHVGQLPVLSQADRRS